MKRAVNVIMTETERSTVVRPLGKGGALEAHVLPERVAEICRKIAETGRSTTVTTIKW
jgi:hypothetical protein